MRRALTMLRSALLVPLFVALAAAQQPINGLVPGMINSGTPHGVPASYDCSVRECGAIVALFALLFVRA